MASIAALVLVMLWLTTDEETGCLLIQDDGPGNSPEELKEGMGTRLIAGFAAQLGVP